MTHMTLADVFSSNPVNPVKFHSVQRSYGVLGIHFHIETALEEVFQATEVIELYGERYDLIPLHRARRTGWSFGAHAPIWNLWEPRGATDLFHVYSRGRRLFDVAYTYAQAYLATSTPNWNRPT